jgi:uncharacterized protein (TIGR03000 family)
MIGHGLSALRAPALSAALLFLFTATAAAQPGPGGGFYQGRYYPSRYGYSGTPYGFRDPTANADFFLYGDPGFYQSPSMFLYAHPETVLYPAPPGGATVEVKVPAAAEVWFDDEPTRHRGEFRRFVSPPLAPGKEFHYDVRARWKEGDRVVDQTRTVGVRSGQTTEVDFNRPEKAPAPKDAPPEK